MDPIPPVAPITRQRRFAKSSSRDTGAGPNRDIPLCNPSEDIIVQAANGRAAFSSGVKFGLARQTDDSGTEMYSESAPESKGCRTPITWAPSPKYELMQGLTFRHKCMQKSKICFRYNSNDRFLNFSIFFLNF